VIDPRFPEMREYLIGLYERAVRAWDLDGLKLDFIDSFNLPKAMENELSGGRDYDSVPEAVDCLLTELLTSLRAIKPDFMVEFRQHYVGPLMRKYGNMFRACDCPDDSISNRVRTIDVRLLCGNTAAHADMVMWHPDEPVESAALQLVQTLFAVPQVSMLLDKLPERHLAMLTFWLKFWREHRDVLLDGHFTPLQPEALFPVVIATTAATRVVAVYGDVVVNPGADAPAELLIVNGTLLSRVVLEIADDLGVRAVEVLNCCGEVVRRETLTLTPGLHALAIPACGVARCVAKCTGTGRDN
jgi:alpha-galactosidase